MENLEDDDRYDKAMKYDGQFCHADKSQLYQLTLTQCELVALTIGWQWFICRDIISVLNAAVLRDTFRANHEDQFYADLFKKLELMRDAVEANNKR